MPCVPDNLPGRSGAAAASAGPARPGGYQRKAVPENEVIPCICPRCNAPMVRITPRRREVLEALADGLEDKEIASRLHISVATVRTLLQVLYIETCCAGRVRLAVWWVRMRAGDLSKKAA